MVLSGANILILMAFLHILLEYLVCKTIFTKISFHLIVYRLEVNYGEIWQAFDN